MRTKTVQVGSAVWVLGYPDYFAPVFNTMLVTVKLPTSVQRQTLRLTVANESIENISETRQQGTADVVSFRVDKICQALWDAPIDAPAEDTVAVVNIAEFYFRLERWTGSTWEQVDRDQVTALYGSWHQQEALPYSKIYTQFPSYVTVAECNTHVLVVNRDEVEIDTDSRQGWLQIPQNVCEEIAQGVTNIAQPFIIHSVEEQDPQHPDEPLQVAEGVFDCVANDNKHVCLRFINRFGAYSTAVFVKDTDAITADTASAWNYRPALFDERQMNSLGVYPQQTHVQRSEVRTVTCGLQNVNDKEADRLSDIFLSARVELWLGADNWQTVTVADGGITRKTGQGDSLQEVSLTYAIEGRSGQC